MKSLLAAEVLKLVTARAYLGLVLGAAAVAALGTVSTMSSGGAAAEGALADQQFFLIAITNLSVFAVVLGVKSFTDEFRHGTIHLSVLLQPSRSSFVVAKMLTCLAAGVVLAALAQLVMVVLATSLGWSGFGDPAADWRALLAVTAGTGAWAALGVALGGLMRHQVAAVVTGLIWVLLVENLGAALLGGVGRWLPGQAVQALVGARPADDLLPEAVAASVLGGYLVLATFVTSMSISRRDV